MSLPTESERISQGVNSNELAIRLLLTACAIGAGAVLVGWLWPSSVMEVPLASISIPVLIRAAAAMRLGMGTLVMLVAIWSSEHADS